MSVQVIIPKNSNINSLIRRKYTELWQQWRIQNFPNRSYTRAKLNANIRNTLSVNGKIFNEQDFRPSIINKWNGRRVLPFAHWYFLIRFQADLFGNVYAIIEDACYEGDYHNDTMTTKPYENKIFQTRNVIRLTENQFMNLLTECISDIIKKIA